MYHLELRQFPHNTWRFNLSEQELRAIAMPWAAGHVVELGERRWSPEQAKITILEGPQLDPSQLSMGRGWRAAQRESQDVTERVLAAAREAVQAAAAAQNAAAVQAAAEAQVAAQARVAQGPASAQPIVANGSDHPAEARAPASTGSGAGAMDPLTLGVQIAALLGPDAVRLLDAWRTAAVGAPALAPSESLALAEQALRDAAGS